VQLNKKHLENRPEEVTYISQLARSVQEDRGSLMTSDSPESSRGHTQALAWDGSQAMSRGICHHWPGWPWGICALHS
jgi:hypothetical protein